MKTMRKCPNCQMNTSKQIAEGITHRKWYRYFECTECKRTQSYRINRPAVVETEYSVSSMESTPIGINAKDWPDNG
jgi:hypothetical protein